MSSYSVVRRSNCGIIFDATLLRRGELDMRKITPLILIAIFCVSLMIPMAAIPMENEILVTTPEEESLPAAEGATGHELRIPIFHDETVENSTPNGNRDGDEFQGGLFVGLESNEDILARTFLKFDMRSYPANLGFQSAYLFVHLNAEYLAWDDQDVPIGAYYCANDSWTDDTITWNNQPSFSATPTDVIDSPASPDMFDPQGWYAWDITPDVTTALAGDRILTEVLKITDEVTPSSCWKYFTEYEYNVLNSSYIAIEYNEPVLANMAVNGISETPDTYYLESPGVLSWDILGDGPDESQSDYNLMIYDQPGATGSLIYADNPFHTYSVSGPASWNSRPFGTDQEMRFQFKYGDDLLYDSGVIDRIGWGVDLTSGSIGFENISIYMVAVDDRTDLTSDFEANYDGNIPTPVFYRDSYTAEISSSWIYFDIDNFFYLSERSSLLVELRWMGKSTPNPNSRYTSGLNGSVAYSYGAGATLDDTADYTYDRMHAMYFRFVSDVVADEGSGINSYPWGTTSHGGAFQYKYNRSLLSDPGIIDRLYFSVDSFNGLTTLGNLSIWLCETPVEGALSTTFADNYGGATPILVLEADEYTPRNLGNTLEFDVDDLFYYTWEHDLLIEIRYWGRTGDNIWSFRELTGGGGYRAVNSLNHTATTAGATDDITNDLDIAYLRDSPITLPDTLNEGEYYYARISSCDSMGIWSGWSELCFKYDSVPTFTGDKIRVAIYDESNSTVPVWTTGAHAGGVHNNASGMKDVLRSYGYDVDLVTTSDIENHILTTANFDVFVMVDNLPRESVVDYIREYWLGGGGILALDGSGQYLSLIGAIPVEAEGTDGWGDWVYYTNDHNISTIHPVTRGYTLHEIIDSDDGYNFLSWNETALSESASAPDITILARSLIDPNWITALALEPHNLTRGGKAVTIGTDLAHLDEVPLYQMFADAVAWLAPKPKARIAYDLSHQPYYCVDTWDGSLTNYSSQSRHELLRNELVSKGYTFDKFYPSASGNITLERLSPYDLLIILAPNFNYTYQEVMALKTWIEDGGSLMIHGEWNGFEVASGNVNEVLDGLEADISLYIGPEYGTSTIVEFYDHPTIEDVKEIMHSGGSYVNVTGNAVPLTHLGNDMTSAVQDMGSGRIYVSGDINTFSNFLDDSNNTRYAVNMFNWLTSSEAKVLAYVDNSPLGIEPNWNIYRGPVAEALNMLGIEFYMSTNRTYFEDLLNLGSWDLVVIDTPVYSLSAGTYTEILEYMESGGRLAISSPNTGSTHELWDYLGIAGSEDILNPPTHYVWDSLHPIFESPIDFSASSFTSSFTPFPFTPTAANLSLHQNATGLAGTVPANGSINVGIAESVNGRAIVNGLLLTVYEDDADLSGYEDGFEIWLNEIVYMLRPGINSPADILFEIGTTGNEFTWTPTSSIPWLYSIEIDTIETDSGYWNGSSFAFNVDSYPEGDHSFRLTVWDERGGISTDEVIVTAAVDLTDPILSSPLDVVYNVGEGGNTINWTATDAHPDNYIILVNGTAPIGYPAEWNTTNIVISVDGLSVGIFNFTIVVFDSYGNSATDTVFVTVLASTTTTTTTTTGTTTDTGTTTPPPVDNTLIIIIVVIIAGVVAIIIIIVIMKKKGGGGS